MFTLLGGNCDIVALFTENKIRDSETYWRNALTYTHRLTKGIWYIKSNRRTVAEPQHQEAAFGSVLMSLMEQ